ncbi:zinc-binding dehydrogenase [Elizabethkingia sp. JS20170427COW]|uniref:zinc-binding dehydrogenase n=1 Tax=Elizabethkingia sp. JS20170427COW TaxID=2583851 RepID=UPI0021064A4B|nr:zinc-binding dehydrogenase [Elizabethkingia sp. JS20170427COW]
MGGQVVEHLDLQKLMLKRATITGSTMRGRSLEEKHKIAKSLIAHVWPLIEAGHCKPLIDKVFPFEQVVEAHKALDQGDHIGKIVLSLE